MASTSKPALHFDDLREAARRYGTPTYVYFEDVVRHRCRRLRAALAPLPVRIFYAMKANSNPALLQIVRDERLGLEAVSPAEVLLALRLGFPASEIFFSPNNMTDEEMNLIGPLGVLFNIGEPSRVERYGRAFPGSEISLRINPDHGDGHHPHVVTAGERTKFGIPLDDLPRTLQAVARHGLHLVGLHQHIGSGIDSARSFREASEVLLQAASGLRSLRFLNFGGGLNVPYRPGVEPFDVEHLRTELLPRLHEERRQRGNELEFWFEPGRYIVAESGVLLTRVNTVKRAGTRTYAGTDTGFNHLIRPTLYGAYHGVYNLSNPAGPLLPYDVVGNICESGDRLAVDRPVQEIREDDLLAIQDAGAYGMSMASEYNLRPLPAEVLVQDDRSLRLIRRRTTHAELADRLIADTVGREARSLPHGG